MNKAYLDDRRGWVLEFSDSSEDEEEEDGSDHASDTTE